MVVYFLVFYDLKQCIKLNRTLYIKSYAFNIVISDFYTEQTLDDNFSIIAAKKNTLGSL